MREIHCLVIFAALVDEDMLDVAVHSAPLSLDRHMCPVMMTGKSDGDVSQTLPMIQVTS